MKIPAIVRLAGLVLALILAFGASSNYVSAEGATVVHGVGCGVLDGNGNPVLDADADIPQVTTPSGNNLVTCRGEVTPPASGETVVFKVGCESFGELTSNGQEVVRPDGGYTLVCRFNPSGQ